MSWYIRPIILALAFLGGCQGLLYDTGAGIPPGSVLELNRPVTIPAGRVSVWIQQGAVRADKDRYETYCKFEIRTMAPQPRIVEPDRFRIRRVQRGAEGMLAFGVHAGIGIFGGGGGPSPTPYTVDLYLESERQPDVLRLTCQRWQDPTWPGAGAPGVREIRRATGDLFTLHLAG